MEWKLSATAAAQIELASVSFDHVAGLRALIAVCLVVFALLAAFAACPLHIDGRIVGVTDGDTITLLDTSNRLHNLSLRGTAAPAAICSRVAAMD